MEQEKSLEELVGEVPPEYRKEVRLFIEFLIEKKRNQPRKEPMFDWAGTAEDLKDKYTSVELQREVSKWRTEEK